MEYIRGGAGLKAGDTEMEMVFTHRGRIVDILVEIWLRWTCQVGHQRFPLDRMAEEDAEDCNVPPGGSWAELQLQHS